MSRFDIKNALKTITSDNIVEYIAYSVDNDKLVTAIRQNIEAEDINNDVDPQTAFFSFLVKLHKQESRSKYFHTITTIYNPNIYPGETIKFLWYGETLGGMVLDVQHQIQIMPQNKITGRTTISYTDYSLTELQDIIKYKPRPEPEQVNG